MTTSTKKRTDLTKKQIETFQSYTTVSAQIRFLTSRNYTRSEIVTYICKNGLNKNIRYQHVRNVQITPVTKTKEQI